MLKLEKSKDRDIAIRLKEQDRFFTKMLWKALGLALAFHLSAILFFHIQPFKLTSSFIFPPINVQSLPMWDSHATLESEQQIEPLDDLSTAPQIGIEFPHVPEMLQESTNKFTVLSEGSIPSFSVLERSALPIQISSSIDTFYNPISIYISGNIAQRPLINKIDSIFTKEKWMKQGDLHYYAIKYLVQLDPESGEIFWYDRKKSSGLNELDRWSEEKLLTLKFLPNSNFEHLVGEVDFFVTLDDQKSVYDLRTSKK